MSPPPLGLLAEGTRFHDRYEVGRCLRSGGMGAVYECVHLSTQKRRALKVMLPPSRAAGGTRRRIQLAARVTAQIESEHIVETFDAGVDPATGAPFLVMELLQGDDLGTIVEGQGPLSAEERSSRSSPPGGARARQDARGRRRPPRPQAAEPVPDGARRRLAEAQDPRLRHRQDRDRRLPGRAGDGGGRDPGLHGAGAGEGRRDHRATGRPLRHRPHRLHAPRGRAVLARGAASAPRVRLPAPPRRRPGGGGHRPRPAVRRGAARGLRRLVRAGHVAFARERFGSASAQIAELAVALDTATPRALLLAAPPQLGRRLAPPSPSSPSVTTGAPTSPPTDAIAPQKAPRWPKAALAVVVLAAAVAALSAALRPFPGPKPSPPWALPSELPPGRFDATIQSGVDGKCLVFGGNGKATFPSRHLWGTGTDAANCGLGSRADLLENKQAVFTFVPLGEGRYVITNASDGAQKCLIFGGNGMNPYPSRHLWGGRKDHDPLRSRRRGRSPGEQAGRVARPAPRGQPVRDHERVERTGAVPRLRWVRPEPLPLAPPLGRREGSSRTAGSRACPRSWPTGSPSGRSRLSCDFLGERP